MPVQFRVNDLNDVGGQHQGRLQGNAHFCSRSRHLAGINDLEGDGSVDNLIACVCVLLNG